MFHVKQFRHSQIIGLTSIIRNKSGIIITFCTFENDDSRKYFCRLKKHSSKVNDNLQALRSTDHKFKFVDKI